MKGSAKERGRIGGRRGGKNKESPPSPPRLQTRQTVPRRLMLRPSRFDDFFLYRLSVLKLSVASAISIEADVAFRFGLPFLFILGSLGATQYLLALLLFCLGVSTSLASDRLAPFVLVTASQCGR